MVDSTPGSGPEPNPASSAAGGQPPFQHRPVMVDDVVALVEPLPEGCFLDATLGGGGHTEAILAANPGLSVLGIDRDPAALKAAGERLRRFGQRVVLQRNRFDQADLGVGCGADDGAAQHPGLSGFLFDLGVSSPQLDWAERGFSFRNDGPLDMRMDPDASISADDVVNTYGRDELADLIRRNSDERFAARIATAIVGARPISTTGRLAEVVVSAIPAPARRRGGHPAKRTFQAIRIEVNDELRILGPALERVLDALVPGGRGIVITYHSGEDKITKDVFRARTEVERPPGLPVEGPEPGFKIVRPMARRPSDQELADNPRAASARLRTIERVAA